MNRNSPHLRAETLRTLLFEIGDELANAGAVAEIAVYGGSALLLTFDSRPATRDVDCVTVSGSANCVSKAADSVGAKHGLEEGWLNDAVSIFRSETPDYRLIGDFPPDRPGLRVFAAKPEYLLAMKLLAMRSPFETNDLKDIWDLIDVCGVRTPEEARSYIGKFYPGESMATHKALLLNDLFEAKERGEEYSPMLGWCS